ncbi:OprD family porin [Halopseudomonas yangmingensis]|uniref:Outer membrane porin, OprD family n=1 Tax=Halopseudomonas yangmingensis TaxID=1720063 RepID=A0A1I4QB73_9GAMM|nr:OprD family porin [Halopseudomonas yangmingensis]SFM37297.1 outer membrane porin, OprD family [Halopseudomonas yangmingensis]
MHKGITGILGASLGCALLLPTSLQAGGFIEDSSASLQLRNFYFNRDFRGSSAPNAQSKAEEWAQGVVLRAESGYTPGAVGFGLDAQAMLGIRLDSDDQRAGTGLLPNRYGDQGPAEYSQLLMTAKAKVSNSTLRIGSLYPQLPIAQASDIRLLPQSYSGAMLQVGEIDNLDLQAGQLRETSYRASTDREDIAATLGGSSDRFNYLGGSYRFTPQTSLGLWRGQLQDVYRQDLVNLIHSQPLGDWTLGANLAWFETRDHGSQRLTIDHSMKSLMLSAAQGGHTLRLGYQHSDGDTAFPYLRENNPYIANYVQVLDFARADEKSWQARYDFDFATVGIPGLKALARYIRGSNIDMGAAGRGKEWERDLDVTYAFQTGPLKNLSIQWRNAMVRSDAIRDIDENRLILNYKIALR